MRAIVLQSFESGPVVGDLPTPTIGGSEVLVRVRAASLNPFDLIAAAGGLKDYYEHRFPVTLGRDLAGVVEAVGPDVTRYAAGDAVFGFINTPPVLHDGSFAEYVASPEDRFIAPKPASVDFVQAAAVPLAGVTALLAVDAIAPVAGDRVLVVGATGGVGSYAVQLAAGRGATVIATGRPEDEEYLRSLGAAGTVDYTAGGVAEAVRGRHPDGIAGLIDLVNFADGFAALAGLVAPGGRAASPLGAADVEGLAAKQIAAANVMASPDPALFGRLAQHVDAGELRIPIQRTFPFAAFDAAIQSAHQQHTQGKLVLTLD